MILFDKEHLFLFNHQFSFISVATDIDPHDEAEEEDHMCCQSAWALKPDGNNSEKKD